MKHSLRICLGLLPPGFLMGLALLTQAQVTKQPATPPPVTAPVPSAAQPDPHRGERIFNANCFRCHQAPETLNPRITGTVIRHMRVRANLSAADERDILRFLNP